MSLTKIELAQLIERVLGEGRPLTRVELEKLDKNLIKKRQDIGLESNKEKIVLSGFILYDLRQDCTESKNADKRNRYIQRAWGNLCRRSE